MDEQAGYAPDNAMDGAEEMITPELKEFDDKIKTSASYLERMDQVAFGMEIDAGGSISLQPSSISPTSSPKIEQYRARLLDLFKSFEPYNLQYARFLQGEKGTLDVKIINGAVVVTFDSSKGIPAGLMGENSSERGFHKRATKSEGGKGYLGLIGIDLNPAKRERGTSPTVSAVHEMHHHCVALSDYLQTIDPEMEMNSADRHGRSTALYGDDRNRMTTDQAIIADKDKYSMLLGRAFNYSGADERDLSAQIMYLDELHSSFLQRKSTWFAANAEVYTPYQKGKHTDVIGQNESDRENTKKLVGLIQAFYILDSFATMFKQMKASGKATGPEQNLLMTIFSEAYTKAGSLIGASRCVKQAERLLSEHLAEITKQLPNLLSREEFRSHIATWYKNGHAAENLKALF